MSANRKTRAELEAALEAATKAFADEWQKVIGQLDEAKRELVAARHSGQKMRALMDDLKERLAFSEAERQRLTGYLERVQEDDIVREELVTVGEPGGEQHLVPKRKHAPPRQLVQMGDRDLTNERHFAGCRPDANEPRKRSPHGWVTY